MKYSIFSLAANALTGHKKWAPAWRDASPKPAYDAVIVGGGGTAWPPPTTWPRSTA